MYQPRPGDRVRVTRRRPNGRIHFTKTGRVLDTDQYGYRFADDVHGTRYLAADPGEYMPGWTQTIKEDQ